MKSFYSEEFSIYIVAKYYNILSQQQLDNAKEVGNQFSKKITERIN